MKGKKQYNVWKGLWKVVEIFIYAGLGGLLAYYSKQPQTPTIVLTVAFLKWFTNFLKHSNLLDK